jgi:hypothetical protein
MSASPRGPFPYRWGARDTAPWEGDIMVDGSIALLCNDHLWERSLKVIRGVECVPRWVRRPVASLIAHASFRKRPEMLRHHSSNR